LQLAGPAPAPLTITEEKDSKWPITVPLKGRFLPVPEFEPFKVRVRVVYEKDEKSFEELEVTKLTDKAVNLGDIPLRRGDNRIEVRLSNEWHKNQLAGEWHVILRRPPFVTQLDLPKMVEVTKTTAAAEVRFPKDAPLTRVVVNGREHKPKDVLKGEKTDDKAVTTAGIEVDVVPLPNKGADNPVTFEVYNDGGSDKTQGSVFVKADPPPKPTVIVRNADGGELIFRDRRVKLHLVVKSESEKAPLTRVEIKRDNTVVNHLDVSGQQKDPAGGFLLEKDIVLE